VVHCIDFLQLFHAGLKFIKMELDLRKEIHLERDRVIISFCQAIRDGQQPSAELCEKFHDGVREIASRRLSRMGDFGDDLDDLVSVAEINCFKALKEGRFITGKDPATAYVSKVAKNVGINHIRDSQVRKRREVPSSDFIEVNKHDFRKGDTTRKKAETRMFIELVIRKIACLTEPQRQVMERLPFYTSKEIIEQLEINEGELKSRIYRARANLELLLGISKISKRKKF
jgi:RNA polymerase sigma factor (sigma-70 family)